ncbi:DUF1993 family protein [Vreelandella sp. 2A-K22]|uniref:DUF1993 family protein n=1 Tax=unclassified Halomonas TaxID=2609666 RepID=UPI0004B07E26|nr:MULTISPECIES: DUF1993 family protein [unclassified Halomonas]NAO98652.1 DUF1993 family protein [Halomonas sp. MG34]PKH61175.1 DUF1993 domain-containing protein [Halomonas sp. Choline-3u-9]QGQ70780.1 DUF1993 domain-containing protein [Halomonas sp. PA16-9]
MLALVANQAIDHENVPEHKHLELGGGIYVDLTGEEYVADFLLPNFYFHLVTTYSILRSVGVPIGKKDYMLHLMPKVKQSTI